MASEFWEKYGKGYYEEFKKHCFTVLGGKCAVCGSTESLEIDHIDPTTKSFTVTQMLRAPKDLLDKELAKCQLLCKDHHQDKTGRASHGTGGMYRHHKCRCEPCKEANRQYVRDYRARQKSA